MHSGSVREIVGLILLLPGILLAIGMFAAFNLSLEAVPTYCLRRGLFWQSVERSDLVWNLVRSGKPAQENSA